MAPGTDGRAVVGTAAHRAKALLLGWAVLVAFAWLILFARSAHAQCEPYSGSCETPSSSSAPGRPGGHSGDGGLALTGADITLLVATGIAAIGTGTLIVRHTRPRSNRR